MVSMNFEYKDLLCCYSLVSSYHPPNSIRHTFSSIVRQLQKCIHANLYSHRIQVLGLLLTYFGMSIVIFRSYLGIHFDGKLRVQVQVYQDTQSGIQFLHILYHRLQATSSAMIPESQMLELFDSCIYKSFLFTLHLDGFGFLNWSF